ncbi:hypothetical protein [Alteromonas oceanisediminis]|uniref:hypothetical protein n=1 Tax=Alteromonas oceanisediminis TaxID=2836180 RepID=UPI001BD9B249|nr:hypothetical protein [Alteromonas oceanisediminis]MBT0588107.1 hypothetical protein [Alteromonas oceanisediminis]
MKIVLITLVLFLSGCSSTQIASPHKAEVVYSDTMEIIRSAAESAPTGIAGEYTLKIKAAGNQGPYVYLNTEFDYRDQRAVTVALHPSVISLFVQKYGVKPQEYFINKSIRVNGEAQRVKITFGTRKKPSNKYYYQTHIRIMDISQIEVLSGHA